MPPSALQTPISLHIWETKYRCQGSGRAADANIAATWDRVADALSAPEPHEREVWRARFRAALEDFRFLPGGRILAGAGTDGPLTLFNCFAAGTLIDTIPGVFAALSEAMQTLQAGGGIGCDFSPLSPAGTGPGPVAFLSVWDAACAALATSWPRRGAMMGALRCDHPDIERFVQAKRTPGALRHFNLSVLVSDSFMRAVERDEAMPLVFGEDRRPVRSVRARALWADIQRAAFDTGDPGVLFIDHIRAEDNLAYAESIAVTNPCGEVPLPPHGACNLGAINLTRFVVDAFGPRAALDMDAIGACVALAVRMLDNAYEVTRFPLKEQEHVAHASRRIGLGITGLGDTLAMLGLRFGSKASLALAAGAMRTICHAAYRSSIALARERGAFPAFDSTRYLASPFIASLPQDIRRDILVHGIRNSHLTAVAPAGSISLLANNISSGVEPIFALQGHRVIRRADGSEFRIPVQDEAWRLWRERKGEQAAPPDSLIEAYDVPPHEQLRMQAAVQPYVDQAVSKTINIPADTAFERHSDLFALAYRLGLKGCTMYRPNPARPAVMDAVPARDAC